MHSVWGQKDRALQSLLQSFWGYWGRFVFSRVWGKDPTLFIAQARLADIFWVAHRSAPIEPVPACSVWEQGSEGGRGFPHQGSKRRPGPGA